MIHKKNIINILLLLVTKLGKPIINWQWRQTGTPRTALSWGLRTTWRGRSRWRRSGPLPPGDWSTTWVPGSSRAPGCILWWAGSSFSPVPVVSPSDGTQLYSCTWLHLTNRKIKVGQGLLITFLRYRWWLFCPSCCCCGKADSLHGRLPLFLFLFSRQNCVLAPGYRLLCFWLLINRLMTISLVTDQINNGYLYSIFILIYFLSSKINIIFRSTAGSGYVKAPLNTP